MNTRNPFEGLDRLLDRMSRQINEASGSRDGDRYGIDDFGTGSMNVDVVEEGDEVVVTADLPGFERDEIEVRVMNDVVQIRAERDRREEHEESNYLRSERRHDAIRRSITLPQPADADTVTATSRNGVLTIRLPKLEIEDRGRNVPVE